MTRIVLTDPRSTPDRVDPLRRAYPAVDFVVVKRDQAVAAVADADAVFGSLRPEEYAAAPKLRWVQSAGAGVEWLWKIPGIADSNLVVTNTRGAHAATIAEHTFALLLALTRQLPAFAEYQQREEWARGQIHDRLVGIKGLTMGIVGFGNIGRNIGRRAAAFEMEVVAVDARPGAPGDGVEEVWPLDRLDEMCGRVDVLVISAPITPETRRMVGPKQIGAMKDGSYLLAMSRGGIVDEPSLIDALGSGKLAGAALDVAAVEPLPPGDPLWKAPNLIITPHSSPGSQLTMDLVWSMFHENVGHFVRGEPLTNTVDKKLGY